MHPSQNSRVRQRSAPAERGRSAERAKCVPHDRHGFVQRPAVVGGLSQGTYSGFKVAVAVIVFHFGVKMLVQFADILLPFIMALLLSTVLEPVKQVTLEVLECTLIVLFQRVGFCSCCLRRVRRENGSIGNPGEQTPDTAATPGGPSRSRADLHELMKRFLLLVSITITVLLAGRLFWLVGRVVWLSGEAVTHDYPYYHSGVEKRGSQVKHLLKRFHLQEKAQLDMKHMGDWALKLLQYSAEFLTQHVFYTLTQISLTTIFVLFLLYSPVQRDFSPVMRVVFESMELYLKLKTLISLMMGVTNGIALAVIGLELPAAWGLLTFLANFIPNIGGPVMSILPCVIALLDVRKTFYQVSAAFLAQFFLHFNIANFVEPVVFGTTEEIHSVVVLLGLSFFGYIWGFTGMFLSVPMLFAIHAWLKTVAQSVNCAQEARDDARFIMGILEGRWLADDDFGVEEFPIGVAAPTEYSDVSMLGPLDSQTEGPDSPATSKDVDPSQSYPAQSYPTQSYAPHGHSLLATQMDPTRSCPEAMRQDSMGGAEEEAAPQPENQPPISSWKVMLDLQAIFAVRDPDTDDVRLQGLILRWVLLAGAYIAVFFGFAIFHWDLHALIHPGKEPHNPSVHAVGSEASPVDADMADVLSTTDVASTSLIAAATTAVAGMAEATTTLMGSLAAKAGVGAGANADGKGVSIPTGLMRVADAVNSLEPPSARKPSSTSKAAVAEPAEPPSPALQPSSTAAPRHSQSSLESHSPSTSSRATLTEPAEGPPSEAASEGKSGLKLRRRDRPEGEGMGGRESSASSTALPPLQHDSLGSDIAHRGGSNSTGSNPSDEWAAAEAAAAEAESPEAPTPAPAGRPRAERGQARGSSDWEEEPRARHSAALPGRAAAQPTLEPRNHSSARSQDSTEASGEPEPSPSVPDEFSG